MGEATDVWAEWLRSRRTGGSEEQRQATLAMLAPIRDKILDDAAFEAGDTVLDVGCGDGLVGLGALERGADVIFSDISQPCLDDCRTIAGDRARYHLASVTELGDVEADVVTMRSVVIYVDDKQRAFEELFRVLRPGGRLSIFEPINRFGADQNRRTLGGFDLSGVEPVVEKVLAAYDDEAESTLVDFDERDLFRFAEAVGFDEIRLDLRLEAGRGVWKMPRSWEVFVDTAPNPLAPTLAEAMHATLTAEERCRLVDRLRPQVEQGGGRSRSAKAFLLARKA
jgi:arsenite methyltransferase